MSEVDPAVRAAGDLLVARLVDHDDRAVNELVEQIVDVEQARRIITVMLLMLDETI
jgi:hypothetical protein